MHCVAPTSSPQSCQRWMVNFAITSEASPRRMSVRPAKEISPLWPRINHHRRWPRTSFGRKGDNSLQAAGVEFTNGERPGVRMASKTNQ
jgi:hypothetical protein